MIVLTVAVILLAALVGFNLLLTVALARRLRDVEAKGAGRSRGAVILPDLDEVKAGTPVTAFSAVTTSGRTITEEDRFGDRTVYGFFDTGCGVCAEQLRPLVETVRRGGFTTDQVIAFVTHDPDGEADLEKYTSVLESYVTVVVHREGEVTRPFEPGGFPGFVLADPAGLALRSGVEVSHLDDVLVRA
ncbi:hypothetical protein ACFVTZ_14005 [Cellulosimicrobium cellulans]|uniref:hypothetical protein n=1 Tax=Cellulosimicrobium cellulans TaxID=1710 RepID=UPI0036E2083B